MGIRRQSWFPDCLSCSTEFLNFFILRYTEVGIGDCCEDSGLSIKLQTALDRGKQLRWHSAENLKIQLNGRAGLG
jgi:hypothetical protein